MKKIIPYFLLTVFVGLAYGNTLQYSFHFDDIPSILEKPWIRGLDKIPDFIFSFAQRPLVILSFNINYAISEFEVWSYHVFNITFHLIAVFLVYRLAQLILSCMTRTHPTVFNALYRMPFLAALLFALHPLNTQAVTYISSRSSVLATLFYLATIILFFEGLNKKESRKTTLAYGYIIGAVICFALGLLSKLIVISLPAVLFAYHYYFISQQNLKKWLTQQWKWIAGVGGLIIIAVSYKKLFGGGFLKASPTDFTGLDYFRTQIAVIPFEYFRKMMFPFNLTIDPDFQLVPHWTSVSVLGGMFILGILLIAWLKISGIKDRSNKYGPEAFGFIWILITLSPTSSVVPLLDMAVEHRTYLPLVGWSIVLASVLARFNYFIQQSTANESSVFSRHGKLSGAVVICVLLLLVSFLTGTRDRNLVWKDEISLWADAKQKTPFMPRAYNNLGEAYDRLGDYDKAIKEFEAGLRLNPNYFFALSNLGNVYGKKKEYEKAIEYFTKALAIKSDYATGHYNMAKALHVTGNPGKAAESYRLAIKYNPYFEEAFFNLGFLALELRQFSEAIDNFIEFLKMQPKHPRAHFGLGTAYAMMGEHEEARAYYENAIGYDPEFISPYINLANLNMAAGKIKEAKTLLQGVLLKNPDLAGVHKNLGLVFLQENNFKNASQHLKEYLRLAPMAPDASAIQSILKNETNSTPD